MKKQSIFFLVAVISTLLMVSCGKNKAKDANLTNLNDSLNYSLGYVNGDAIKMHYMQDVTNENSALNAFVGAMEKAFNSTEQTNEMYDLGLQIGGSFKEQEKNGLMGEEQMTFNYNLARQGFMDGLNNTEGGMTAMEAQQYIQSVMTQLRQESLKKLQELNTTEEPVNEEAN